MRPFLLLSTLLIACYVEAQTTSTNDGSWSNAFNWTSGVPVSYQNATINNDMILDSDLNVGNGGDYHVNTGTITDPTGGTAYDLNISGSGNVEVDGNVTLEGDLNLTNSGTLVIRSYDTLQIGGNAELKNSSSLTIEEFGVLLIEGNLTLRNTNSSLVNGNIYVGGDLTSRNSSTINGTGNIETEGEIDIRNSSSIFGSTSDCNPGPCEYGSGEGLPISLRYFKAKAISETSVLISWETESEVNNDYFLIEYKQGDGRFSTIAKIAGAGNSNLPLTYQQTIVIKDIEAPDHYFRLKQVDFDGKSETFNPVYVKLAPLTVSTKVYPNPSSGNILNLNMSGLKPDSYLIKLINSKGQVTLQKTMLLSDETSVITTELLEGQSLSKGIYFLQVQSTEFTISKKIIVN